MTISKDAFFKPGKLASQDDAPATISAAKQIIAAEALEREHKTEHLRQLRQARQAEAPQPAVAPRRRRLASAKPLAS